MEIYLLIQWINENSDWYLIEIANQSFEIDDLAQPIHGDLHNENVLFDNGKVIFLDLEEFYKTYDSPLYDFSYLFFRFYLPSKDLNNKLIWNSKHTPEECYSKQLTILRRLILIVFYNYLHRRDSKDNFVSELNKFKTMIDWLKKINPLQNVI